MSATCATQHNCGRAIAMAYRGEALPAAEEEKLLRLGEVQPCRIPQSGKVSSLHQYRIRATLDQTRQRDGAHAGRQRLPRSRETALFPAVRVPREPCSTIAHRCYPSDHCPLRSRISHTQTTWRCRHCPWFCGCCCGGPIPERVRGAHSNGVGRPVGESCA